MRYFHLSVLETLIGTTAHLRVSYHPGPNSPHEPAVQPMYSIKTNVPQHLVGAEARELFLWMSEWLYDESENAPTL